jgi:GMP synthase-like glutamine amidotransferase
MIVFVDLEHESGRAADHGEKLLAARAWITYRLEDISGLPCMLVRYDRLSDTLLDHLDARAIFLSGNSTDPANYDATALAPLFSILRDGERPVFGFCGGMQFIARSLDTPVVELPAPEGDDPYLGYEYGYSGVTLTSEHPVLRGLESESIVRHAHRLHIPEPPAGFVGIAETDRTPVQMMVDDQRKMVAAQFHPEYYTDEHPAGRTMIENFLDWATIR